MTDPALEHPLTALARQQPDKPAVVLAPSGATLTYAELDERSSRLCRVLEARGIVPGDHLALIMENRLAYAEVGWACRRYGISCVPVNWHLSADEAAYIVDDSDARAVIVSGTLGELAGDLRARDLPKVDVWLCTGDVEGYERYDEAVAAVDGSPYPGDGRGAPMFYSSGTTGRPKGIQHPPADLVAASRMGALRPLPSPDRDSVYLVPGPLYHAAPYATSMNSVAVGATLVVMERFDALETLRAIERWRVTGGQFVPTHFVRMLKLPEEVRSGIDVSSLRFAIHAAAPCPVEVKHRMMGWWGPILWEYYSATEAIGQTTISPEEWLQKPGSVGRANGCTIHVLDDDGRELPPGEHGTTWFEGGWPTAYHKAPEKTAASRNEKGWRTTGDIGYLDEDGYLFLTDRRDFMIVSGGVNIYPQEAEDVLTMHPAVADVAVFGVPDAEMGEAVKAAVQVAEGYDASPALAQELIAYCRDRLAHYKCPRSIDFVDEMPRLASGKLAKRVLRDPYWQEHGASRIV